MKARVRLSITMRTTHLLQPLPVPDGMIKQVIRSIFVTQLEGLKQALNIKTADDIERRRALSAERRAPNIAMNEIDAHFSASSCSIAASSSKRTKRWKKR